MNEQEATFDAVKDRGYVSNWTMRQFMARQVAKLQEELGELAEICLSGSSPLSRDILFTGDVAKMAFDNEDHEFWEDEAENITMSSFKQIREELADLQVVLFCLTEATVKYSGTLFNVAEAAVEKSTSDIERGVR